MKLNAAALLALFASSAQLPSGSLAESATADNAGEGECVGDVRPAGQTAAEVAVSVFADTDVDSSGGLDLNELARVSLAEEHLSLLAVFDKERDGLDAVDFAGFLGTFDANENGEVNVDELEKFVSSAESLAAAFTKADKDKSGHLAVGEVRKLMDGFGGKEEVAAKESAARVLGIAAFDTDGTAGLSAAEINNYGRVSDANLDGRIEHAEVLFFALPTNQFKVAGMAQAAADEVTAAEQAQQEKEAAEAAAAAAAAEEEAKKAAEEELDDDEIEGGEVRQSKPKDGTDTKKVKKPRKAPKVDASDPIRDDDVLREVEEIERRRIMARVERMKRKIPTPSGKARAAKLAAADEVLGDSGDSALLEDITGSNTIPEDQMRHFMTPSQIKRQEQKARKAANKERRKQERTQQAPEEATQASSQKLSSVKRFKQSADAAHNAFTRSDTNSDGALSKAEIQAIAAEDFDKLDEIMSLMDGDKDGSLSVKEFARFWPAVRRLRPENEALGAPLDNADDTREEASSSTKPNGGSWGVNLKSGKPKQKRNAGVIRAKASQAKKLFATRDDNSDGEMSAKELEYFHLPDDVPTFMAEYDDNHDGHLDEDEFVTAFPAISKAASAYRRNQGEGLDPLAGGDTCPGHQPSTRTLAERKKTRKEIKERQDAILAAKKKLKAAKDFENVMSVAE